MKFKRLRKLIFLLAFSWIIVELKINKVYSCRVPYFKSTVNDDPETWSVTQRNPGVILRLIYQNCNLLIEEEACLSVLGESLSTIAYRTETLRFWVQHSINWDSTALLAFVLVIVATDLHSHHILTKHFHNAKTLIPATKKSSSW